MSLPIDYIQLQYIEFVGGQYIDTGIVPSNHKVETQVNDINYVNDKHYFGTSQNGNYYHFTTYSNSYYWGNNGNEGHTGTWTSGIHNVIFNGDNNAVILDGVTLQTGVNKASTTNLLIGSRTNNTNFTGYVYYFKLTDKTTNALVRNYIPVIRISDWEIGLYDLVSNQLYTNSGTGTFKAGSLIEAPLNISLENNPLVLTTEDNVSLIANFKRKIRKKYLIGV